MRRAAAWTAGCYAAVALLSAPLALVARPATGNPCTRGPDAAWLVWLYRDVLWLSLLLTLPLAVGVAALAARRFAGAPGRAAATGTAAGLMVAAGLLITAVLTAYCEMSIQVN